DREADRDPLVVHDVVVEERADHGDEHAEGGERHAGAGPLGRAATASGAHDDRCQCARHAVVNLFDWIGMRDRYFASRVPSNSNSRLHFTLSFQQRGLYWNVKRRSIAFYVKNKLILRMFADVFQ